MAAASVLQVLENKPPDEMGDETLILADQAKKAVAQLRSFVEELLRGKLPEEQVREVSRLLSQGTWTHDYPISFDQAGKLGLPVNPGMPAEFLELMTMFPQSVRQQPTVEHLPYPRRAPGPKQQEQ